MTDRLKDVASRFKVRDPQVHLVGVSIVAGLILIAALIALPGSSDDADLLADGEATATPALIDPKTGKTIKPGASIVPGGPSAPRTSGSVGAPTAPAEEGGLFYAASVLKVGIAYIADPGTANAAAGFGGIGQVDQKRGWDADDQGDQQEPALRTQDRARVLPGHDRRHHVQGGRASPAGGVRAVHAGQQGRSWSGTASIGGDSAQRLLDEGEASRARRRRRLVVEQDVQASSRISSSPAMPALDRMAQFQVDQLYKHEVLLGVQGQRAAVLAAEARGRQAEDRPDPLRPAVVQRRSGAR